MVWAVSPAGAGGALNYMVPLVLGEDEPFNDVRLFLQEIQDGKNK